MEFDALFTFLYPIVPLVAFFGYIPQIIILVKADRAPKSISISTWTLWTITWLISFGYAIFSLNDPMFAFTCGMNVMAHMTIIILKVYKDIKYKLPLYEEAILEPLLVKNSDRTT